MQGGPAVGRAAKEPGAAAGASGQAQPAPGFSDIPRCVEGRRNRDQPPHLQQTGHGVPVFATGSPLCRSLFECPLSYTMRFALLPYLHFPLYSWARRVHKKKHELPLNC